MISILTTVYNNDKYLREALDSFVESCNGYEYEILVGIDNCKITLKYILSIYPSLNGRIKIFYFTNKVGTYIIRNTLAKKAKYENLIFFDSDDVMRRDTVKNTLESFNNGSIYHRFGYVAFTGDLKFPKSGNLNVRYSHHYGAFGIKKSLFLEMNGFEPWICAADGEFYWRVTANQYKSSLSKDVDILYRRHGENLTASPSTNMQSPLRKSYHARKDIKIKNNLKGPLPNLVTANSLIVDKDFYLKHSNSSLKELESIKSDLVFSIIIPTYNIVGYLKECLESIINSIKDLNCEILVGIDSCENTLEFIKTNSFDYRIKFYFFKKNVGPYIIKNSLSLISSSDHLVFFDSDDIMSEQLINDVIKYQTKYDLIKPMYLDFNNHQNNINRIVKSSETFGEGVFCIKKELFLYNNGFEGWRCAADSDLMKRLYKNNVKLMHTKHIGFYRRIHDTSLTQSRDTGLSSSLRKSYWDISRRKKDFSPLDNLITEEFTEIQVRNNFDGVYETYENLNLINLVKESLNFNPKNEPSKINYDVINAIKNNPKIYDPTKTIKPIRENIPVNRNELLELKKGTLAAQNKEFTKKKFKRNNLNNPFSSKNNF